MARLFSNSVVYGEVYESAPRAHRISVQLLLVGVHEGLGTYIRSQLDTIEV
jgi:hypothetical protein